MMVVTMEILGAPEGFPGISKGHHRAQPSPEPLKKENEGQKKGKRDEKGKKAQ